MPIAGARTPSQRQKGQYKRRWSAPRRTQLVAVQRQKLVFARWLFLVVAHDLFDDSGSDVDLEKEVLEVVSVSNGQQWQEL